MFADVDAIVSFIAVGVSVTAVVIACSCEYCCMVDVFVVELQQRQQPMLDKDLLMPM